MEKKRTYGVWAVRSSTSIFGPAQSWCKENGKPLEFDTKAAAENYAKEANEHTTANVRYYVKEKEPEPGAVRKGTSQPELDARSHEEVIPRNDAAEKQNEIPGRQIPSQTDPLVEIRSAVHSNYAGMVAMLGADNRVYLGREEYSNHVGLLPYALDYLLCLKEHGIKLAVATGLPEKLYIPCLKNNSILELFGALCSTDEVQRGKEYSDVFELAARKLGVAPEHCIVFDDVLPAIKSAKAARMLAGGIYDKYSADQRTEIERIADIYLLDFRQAPIPHKEV